MKLYATVTDSHGKKDGRGDNEYLEVLLNERNENRFLIAFDGKTIKVLNYCNGKSLLFSYEGKNQKGESDLDPWEACENHAYYHAGCSECRALNHV